MIQPVAELLRKIERGDDIPPPKRLLSRVKPEDAARKLDNMPYSMLTNLAHMLLWQDLWLNRLRGDKLPDIRLDWRTPKPEEWPELRDRFLSGFAEVIRIAESDPFQHSMKSDGAAVEMLLNIGIHNSYHLGQINLIKRSLRLAKLSRIDGI